MEWSLTLCQVLKTARKNPGEDFSSKGNFFSFTSRDLTSKISVRRKTTGQKLSLDNQIFLGINESSWNFVSSHSSKQLGFPPHFPKVSVIFPKSVTSRFSIIVIITEDFLQIQLYAYISAKNLSALSSLTTPGFQRHQMILGFSWSESKRILIAASFFMLINLNTRQ